jgi:hypothetical protein
MAATAYSAVVSQAAAAIAMSRHAMISTMNSTPI